MNSSNESSGFTSYLGEKSENNQSSNAKTDSEDVPTVSKIIFDEKDCPKVEVVSCEGIPSKLLIHLEDGKVLEINCLYQTS